MNGYVHRRGSIFWALILIAVGGIFLYHNFHPTLRPWELIAKYWPLLIIFWGASKLMDYVHSQRHPELTPPPLFGVGEVVLLIFILLVGTLISKFALRPWPSSLGLNVEDDDLARLFYNSYTYTQSLSRPAPGKPRLLLVNRRGDVEIHAWDQPTMEAVVKKTLWTSNEEEAKRIADQVKAEIVEQAGQYVFQSNLDALPESGRNLRLDITLRVPRATSAEVTANRGDILLEGLQGEQVITGERGDLRVVNVEGMVRANKSHGDTEVRDVKGNVELQGRGGDVQIAGITGTATVNGEFTGSLQFRDVAQTLRFHSSRTDMTVQRLTGRLNMEVGDLDATGIEGPFEITTRHKDITLNDFSHSVRITLDNGDVRLNTSVLPSQPITVDSAKGEIELTLPANSNFNIEANSRHGDVDCDFSGPNLKVSAEGERPSVAGSYGKGGAEIRLSTAYGTIRLVRGGAGTLKPPKAPPAAPPAPALPAPPRPPALPDSKKLALASQEVLCPSDRIRDSKLEAEFRALTTPLRTLAARLKGFFAQDLTCCDSTGDPS
jgi:DUF4097 and DUF4098 domain-containing protein YvlB